VHTISDLVEAAHIETSRDVSGKITSSIVIRRFLVRYREIFKAYAAICHSSYLCLNECENSLATHPCNEKVQGCFDFTGWFASEPACFAQHDIPERAS
jgi:hypothetical protein